MRNTTEMLVIIGTTSFSYSSDNVDTSGCAQYFKVSTAIPNEAFNYANEDNDIGEVTPRSSHMYNVGGPRLCHSRPIFGEIFTNQNIFLDVIKCMTIEKRKMGQTGNANIIFEVGARA